MGLFDGLKKALQDSKDQHRMKAGKFVPPRDPIAIEARNEQLKSIANGDLTKIIAINSEKLSSDNVPIILKKDELCYGCIIGAQLVEDRAVRVTTDGYVGPRIRVAKGVSIGGGSFGSTSSSHMEKKIVDIGTLILTNNRIVFAGKSKTIEFPLNKIVSVTPIPEEGVMINRSNKQKTEYYMGGYDGEQFSALIHGLIKHLS